MTFEKALENTYPNVTLSDPESNLTVSIADLTWKGNNNFTFRLSLTGEAGNGTLHITDTNYYTEGVEVQVYAEDYKKAIEAMLEKSWNILSDLCSNLAKEYVQLTTNGNVDPNKMAKIAITMTHADKPIKLYKGSLRLETGRVNYHLSLNDKACPSTSAFTVHGTMNSFEFDEMLKITKDFLGHIPLVYLPAMINDVKQAATCGDVHPVEDLLEFDLSF